MFARLTQLCSAALIAFALTAPSFAVAGDVGYHKLKHPQFLRTFLSKMAQPCSHA